MSIGFTIEMSSDPALGYERIIRGDLYPARKAAQGTVVICHGYKGFKDWGMFPYAARALSDRLDVVTFNFSHNGIGEELHTFTELEKFAHNTYSRELEDLAQIVENIKSGTLADTSETGARPGDPVYLLGHSRGAGVCLIYAFDHPHTVGGVISWNGIADVDLFSDEEKEAMRTNGRAYVTNARTGQQMPLDKEIIDDIEHNRERFDIVQRIGETDVPIAIVEGEDDFERLKRGRAKLFERNPALERIVVPGGNHTFGARHPFAGTTEALETAIASTKQVLEKWTER